MSCWLCCAKHSIILSRLSSAAVAVHKGIAKTQTESVRHKFMVMTAEFDNKVKPNGSQSGASAQWQKL
eukprot:SAG11_NODE_8224_length_1045_cov_0.980973_1_plen_67_part_01